MRASTIERLAREHLLPVLPGFAARRALVYRRPLEHFLAAIAFATSSFAGNRIYATAFVQPLYVPFDELFTTFGFRLGDDFWDVDEQHPDATFVAIAEVAQREALPFFDELADLDGFAQPRSLGSLDDPVVTEALGYTEILRGHKEAGLRWLEKTIESAREAGEYANEELIKRPQQVLDAVGELGLEAGQALLGEWRAETIKSLGLEERSAN